MEKKPIMREPEAHYHQRLLTRALDSTTRALLLIQYDHERRNNDREKIVRAPLVLAGYYFEFLCQDWMSRLFKKKYPERKFISLSSLLRTHYKVVSELNANNGYHRPDGVIKYLSDSLPLEGVEMKLIGPDTAKFLVDKLEKRKARYAFSRTGEIVIPGPVHSADTFPTINKQFPPYKLRPDFRGEAEFVLALNRKIGGGTQQQPLIYLVVPEKAAEILDEAKFAHFFDNNPRFSIEILSPPYSLGSIAERTYSFWEKEGREEFVKRVAGHSPPIKIPKQFIF